MNLFSAPRIAWPTLALAGACLAAWGLAFSGALPLAFAIPLATIAAYAAFTPMHDASHGAVARGRVVNAIVGRACALLLLGPYPAAKRYHLEHHRHTNDPEKDPDHWSGSGPAWLLPLRWATQDLHYYVRFIRDPRAFPVGERIETLVTFALVGAAIVAGGAHALLLWVLPARIAIAFLAFAFDWLPHAPHVERDRYRNTRVHPGRIREAILLAQNYHLVHHLWPGVPFYRYRLLWEAKREELLMRGAIEQ